VQQQVEQIDLFAYLDEIEKLQEDQAHYRGCDALSTLQEPILSDPLLTLTGVFKQEPCERCGGSGFTRFMHI